MNQENAQKYIRLWMFNKYLMTADQSNPKLIALSEQIQNQMVQLAKIGTK